MTTYNVLQASWKSGTEIVSDIPKILLEELNQRVTERAQRGGTDLFSFEFAQSAPPLVGLVLAVCGPAESGGPGEPYVHAVVTDAGDGRELPETAMLQLFESIYGAPLRDRVRSAIRIFAAGSLPQDERQAQRYFISEEDLRNFLTAEQLDADPHAAVPLSSLLTRGAARSGAPSPPPNPFLPPPAPSPTRKAAPANRQPSPEEEAAFEAPPRLLPEDPAPRPTSHHAPASNTHKLSWRVFRASALFTAGALIGMLFGTKWVGHDVETAPSRAPAAPSEDAVNAEQVRERLARHAAMISRYQEQFEAQASAFEASLVNDPPHADAPAAAERTSALSPTGSGEPATAFDVMIHNSAYLRAVPSVEGNEPLRILQDGEIYSVIRKVSLADGTWYELHDGWIKATPRIRRVPQQTTEGPRQQETGGKESLLSTESGVR